MEIFIPGDFVSLVVPQLDRASADPSRLLCQVPKVKNQKTHQLQCRYGVLGCWYPTNQLLHIPVSEHYSISTDLGNQSDKISLHAVAAQQSTSDWISIACNCKKKCTGHCRCLKNKVKYSVYCHSNEHDCGNLSSLSTQTEIALINQGSVQNADSNERRSAQQAQLVGSGRMNKRKRANTTATENQASLNPLTITQSSNNIDICNSFHQDVSSASSEEQSK